MPITEPGFIAPHAYFITEGQPFVIRQMGEAGQVLDVYENNPAQNQQVITYPPNGGPNQAWRFVPAGASGWWYLQTTMTTGYVLTMATPTGNSPLLQNVVVAPMAKDARDEQLWSLMPSETLGYWFIQSKLLVSNEYNAKVLGVHAAGGPGISDPCAVVVDVDYLQYEPQVWAFMPGNVTG
ncbi:RICIN domain-containing protein [Variovorax sp. UC122_21]|uniref:RICIN domain-containing protein n=1 Tax=Variovorax sp. UC122_21 TaxID=3374554 RepID=UPI0037568FDB